MNFFVIQHHARIDTCKIVRVHMAKVEGGVCMQG
jgi:hypothetical protein